MVSFPARSGRAVCQQVNLRAGCPRSLGSAVVSPERGRHVAEFPDEEPVLAALFKEPAAAAAVSGEPDDGLAYDGSDGPQRRPLEPGERRLLHRVIGLVADDPRWQWEQ